MTVLPPTFSELVDEAADIVRARVVSVEPFRATDARGGSVIKTRVTWKVTSRLKGTEADETLVLDFLGGEVGDEALEVPGMPHFAVGNDDYLFVSSNRRVICPLIAAGHGRYHVRTDPATGRRYVARQNGQPLTDTAQVVQPLNRPAAATAAEAVAAALTPEQFEAAVRNHLQGRASGK